MKTSFKNTVLILTLALLPQAHAAGPCANYDAILQEFSTTLHFDKAADHVKARNDLGNASDCIAEYGGKKPHDPKQFAAIVQLAAQALPYDEETGVASGIADLVAGDPALNKAYPSALAQITESCRRTYLASEVDYTTCMEDSGKKGACDENKVVDFDKCVSAKRH